MFMQYFGGKIEASEIYEVLLITSAQANILLVFFCLKFAVWFT